MSSSAVQVTISNYAPPVRAPPPLVSSMPSDDDDDDDDDDDSSTRVQMDELSNHGGDDDSPQAPPRRRRKVRRHTSIAPQTPSSCPIVDDDKPKPPEPIQHISSALTNLVEDLCKKAADECNSEDFPIPKVGKLVTKSHQRIYEKILVKKGGLLKDRVEKVVSDLDDKGADEE